VPPARIVFWAATLAGIGFAAYSVLTSPPALHVAVACSFAYGALITAGVLFLRLRMFADAVIRGPEGARGVALTFDEARWPRAVRSCSRPSSPYVSAVTNLARAFEMVTDAFLDAAVTGATGTRCGACHRPRNTGAAPGSPPS
jgi:hypothetical protein